MSALLSVSSAHVAYGKVEAVRAASLDVGDNEIVTIIGANGAGKTTLLNAIMGILPLKGRVEFAGEDLFRLEIEDRVAAGLSLVPEHRELFFTMNVEDNLQLGAFRIARAVAARSFERVGLAGQINQLAGSLSLGQQRIVEIARALCVDPILLLLDEPAAGLRHMEKQRLAALLRQLRDGGMSVLLVEHDMGFVMDLADRIVVLDFGTKIAEGTPQAIRTNPEVIKAYLGAAA